MRAVPIRELFIQRNLRWTKQREEVYAALAESSSHPTAEDLFRLVNSQGDAHARMSLATVYNCLEAFTSCGLARRVGSAMGGGAGGGDGGCRFDAVMHAHAHLVTAGGEVRDVPEDLSDRVLASIPRELVAELEQRLGIRVDRLSVEFQSGEPGPVEN